MEKVTLTNAERQRRLKENSPKIVELNQLRQISNRQEANKDREKANAVLNWETVNSKNAGKCCFILNLFKAKKKA